jgi:hypothetical protein
VRALAKPSQYPEHDKLEEVASRSQSCGEMLDWLKHEKGLVLAEWVTPTWKELGYQHEPRLPIEPRLVPAAFNVRKLLAEFFGIDEGKLEEEKRAMLDAMRAGSSEVVP